MSVKLNRRFIKSMFFLTLYLYKFLLRSSRLFSQVHRLVIAVLPYCWWQKCGILEKKKNTMNARIEDSTEAFCTISQTAAWQHLDLYITSPFIQSVPSCLSFLFPFPPYVSLFLPAFVRFCRRWRTVTKEERGSLVMDDERDSLNRLETRTMILVLFDGTLERETEKDSPIFPVRITMSECSDIGCLTLRGRERGGGGQDITAICNNLFA